MLDSIYATLHYSDNTWKSETEDNCRAALRELRSLGVKSSLLDMTSQTPDPLIKKTLEAYVKWQFDFDGQAERFRAMYQRLCEYLSLAADYKEEA